MNHQLSLSMRAARTIKCQSALKNRTLHAVHRQDAAVSKMSHHRSAASARAIASMAGCSSSKDTLIPSTLSLQGRHNIHRRQPKFSWNIQNMISTSTALLDPNNTNNKLPEDRNAESEPGKEGATEEVSIIPFQRSKRAKSKSEPGGFDDRARAKLAALRKAKSEADDAKASLLRLTSDDTNADINLQEMHEKWNQSEHNLALAYSQAIKYTSRIVNHQEATETAERLLIEWMDRFLDPFGVNLATNNETNDPKTDPKILYLNKKRVVRTINEIVPKLISSDVSSESKPALSATAVKGDTGEDSTLPKIRVPPPTSKDYINLLRAYSMSKARRKGQQCEVLMRNMMQLAKTVAYYYDEEDETWSEDRACDVGMESIVNGEGNEVKKWRSWVADSIPNSKVFALAIKCHAGSTHNESLERIILLNHIHDSFASSCKTHIPGIYADDPYVLYHSIKALKNLQKKEERDKGHEWLGKLHKFVTNPENMGYFHEREIGSEPELTKSEPEVSDKVESTSSDATIAYPQTINVTSAYTTFLRLLARLRGTDGVAADAFQVLNRMHEVRTIFLDGFNTPQSQLVSTDESSKNNDTETITNRERIAYIDVRHNAYNLVLGLYRDSKKAEDARKATDLLQKMIDAGNKSPKERKGVPLPTEQSFEFTILSLLNMTDGEMAIKEAERLIKLMNEMEDVESSVTAYNALLNVCNNKIFGKAQLYDKALDILDRMNEASKTNSGAVPNAETLALVMKACYLSQHEDHERVLTTSSKLFSQLEERESSEKSALALTDQIYYNMMKCVDTHMTEDPNEKKERIEELFSEACQRGLCSANVLTMFRNSVSEEEYELTVGKGRLADHWIANITGPRALYTDGSTGGAGKHARRKGKSTSDWVKKKKAKEAERVGRKKDKKAKKFFKKMKMGA
mmetsp:Transcript_26991/g.46024  ORF Transcript_26991/g.46024 Transcript_26991/m.46024 type:complete len:916 (+) Transcript_26991:80-2827(+)